MRFRVWVQWMDGMEDLWKLQDKEDVKVDQGLLMVFHRSGYARRDLVAAIPLNNVRRYSITEA